MNTPITDRAARPLWTLLQISDSAYPTGSYAHSGGLEGAVDIGLLSSPDAAEPYLFRVFLPSLLFTDVPLVRAAHAAAADAAWEELWAMDELCHALRATRELREASTRVGAQRVALAAATHPSPAMERLAAALTEGRWKAHAPTAFGAVGAVLGIAAKDTAAGYVYQAVTGAVAALVKLLRIGQTRAQIWISRLLEECNRRFDEALETPPASAGWFAPLTEIASARHETAYTRLFIS